MLKILEGITPTQRKFFLSCLSRPPYLLLAYFLTLTSQQATAKDLDGFLKILLTLDLQLTHFDLGQVFDHYIALRPDSAHFVE